MALPLLRKSLCCSKSSWEFPYIHRTSGISDVLLGRSELRVGLFLREEASLRREVASDLNSGVTLLSVAGKLPNYQLVQQLYS
ncbi:hypothetical protein I8752_05610 [Nostocaceae cyanobacterium CENA369]|uniref:Uncharacterized protein n=1 Tax=Dendronalium phyllosphericum CENA369 TaxID=1725256 RepID=A0A8J7I6M6_9NOST|nr:hypothetical protein [Dendronalium phyllosphericum]MBH8572522.1 hypothetical protein [Dendronalium phyllosphericum CENA369]